MKQYILAALAVFLVIFNTGYVFHDLALGAWFHVQLSEVAREHYNIPLIALGYLIYVLILTYFYSVYRVRYGGDSFVRSLVFGLLMGVLFDGLEGGLIEYATMKIPFQAFAVDTLYHTLEGGLAGIILGQVYARVGSPKISLSGSEALNT